MTLFVVALITGWLTDGRLVPLCYAALMLVSVQAHAREWLTVRDLVLIGNVQVLSAFLIWLRQYME